MLYAEIKDKELWPTAWEKCDDMFKYLHKMTWGYQFNIERRMLYDAVHPEYRGALIKWGVQADARNGHKTRDVILETTDPKQMEAALFMLINEAEEQAKQMKWVNQGLP